MVYLANLWIGLSSGIQALAHLQQILPATESPDHGRRGRAVRDLAEKNGWRTVIVVTTRPDVARSRLIFHRCFGPDVIMAASPVSISLARWAYEYTYQTVGFAKLAFDRTC